MSTIDPVITQNVARDLVDWVQQQQNEDLELYIPGIDQTLQALTAAGLLPPDFQADLLGALITVNDEDAENNLADFLG